MIVLCSETLNGGTNHLETARASCNALSFIKSAPPRSPSLSGVQPVRAASTAERPNRKLNWRKPAKYALWGLAVLLVAGMLINRFAGGGSENRAKLLEGDASVKEDFPIDRSSSHYGINIGPDGIEIGDGISIGPDGVTLGLANRMCRVSSSTL